MIGANIYAITACMLQLTINGETRHLPAGSTVADIIRDARIDVREVAIMVGERIIARSAYGVTVLHSGDAVEMVSFIGGG